MGGGITLAAFSVSTTFCDSSLCNLILVEFHFPKLTLGRVPRDCLETYGQLFSHSPYPASSFKQHSLCINFGCSGEVYEPRGVDSLVLVIGQSVRSLRREC